MLTRLQVDNFRCLVGFDLKFDHLNLFLGANGSGKTSVFDVLRRLRGFIAGDLDVDAAFPSRDLTSWLQKEVQQFSLELRLNSNTYLYRLEIENSPERPSSERRVKHESLSVNERVHFAVDHGQMRSLGKDAGFAVSVTRSAFQLIYGKGEHIWFRDALRKWMIVRPCPPIMDFESAKDDNQLSPMGENFPSWYRFVSQEHTRNLPELWRQLSAAMAGFDSLALREAGEKKVLRALFRSGPGKSEPRAYLFNELSDGQRQLILLYSLLYGLDGQGYTLFLDEPDNYVALREIQPWLSALHDGCGETVPQATLISHHPEVIDFLANSAGQWFDRPDNGPARVRDKAPTPVDGLTVSQTIARGWTAIGGERPVSPLGEDE